MRERLIELLKENPWLDTVYGSEDDYRRCVDWLLKNGVIVPPCKVGDTVWRIVDMSHTACKSFVPMLGDKVEAFGLCYRNVVGSVGYFTCEDFGKTVFLAREEAEAALKAREENAAD